MTVTNSNSDSGHSDLEDCPVALAASSVLRFDASLERNYEQVKQLIDQPAPSWTVLKKERLSPVTERVQSIALPSGLAAPEEPLKLREKFISGWNKLASNGSQKDVPIMTPEQEELGKVLQAQMDAFYLCQRPETEAALRTTYSAHVLEISQRTRARVLKNNQKMAEARDAAVTERKSLQLLDLDSITDRDQGFSRSQSLIVAPMKNTAYDVISTLAALWKGNGENKQTVDNWKRFEDEFGKAVNEDEDEEEEAALAASRDRRPEAFKHLFRDNTDDCFRIGIKFTRKSMKLFCDFFSADVIVASPLGLKLLNDPAMDFLSSLEFVVIEQADVLSMQNWDHLTFLLGRLNCIPQKAHGCDFSRVRNVFLDGNGRRLRQSLVLSRFAFPELNASLANRDCFANCMGSVKWQHRGAESIELLKTLAASTAPAFFLLPLRSERTSPADAATARFEFFTRRLLSGLLRQIDSGALPGGLCVFVSSYFDFCQLRAHLTKLSVSFAHISEYSSSADISGARTRFFNGSAKLLLVTERFYFYRRYRIRGIRQLCFYSLPEHPEFFTEWLAMTGQYRPDDEAVARRARVAREKFKWKSNELETEPGEASCVVSPLDYIKVERILGTQRACGILELDQ